jgi:hypothetical protein
MKKTTLFDIFTTVREVFAWLDRTKLPIGVSVRRKRISTWLGH